MVSNIAILNYGLFLVLFGFIGLVTAMRPPLPFLPLDPSSFLEDFRRNLPTSPIKYRNPVSPVLENFGADVKYTDAPIGIDAGFYIRPRYNGRGLPLPPLVPAHVVPDVINNFRQLEQRIFTPSRRNEIPETPGQVKNYENDLQELEKERAGESTTEGFLEDVSVTSTPPASSFVNVGVTRGNKQEYKYNYAL